VEEQAGGAVIADLIALEAQLVAVTENKK